MNYSSISNIFLIILWQVLKIAFTNGRRRNALLSSAFKEGLAVRCRECDQQAASIHSCFRICVGRRESGWYSSQGCPHPTTLQGRGVSGGSFWPKVGHSDGLRSLRNKGLGSAIRYIVDKTRFGTKFEETLDSWVEEGRHEYQLLESTLAMVATACPANVPFLSFSQERRSIRIPEDVLPKHVEKEIQEGQGMDCGRHRNELPSSFFQEWISARLQEAANSRQSQITVFFRVCVNCRQPGSHSSWGNW